MKSIKGGHIAADNRHCLQQFFSGCLISAKAIRGDYKLQQIAELS